MDLFSIAGEFDIAEKILHIDPFGDGHINRTFLVKTEREDRSYILQNINRNIFHDISGLMQNIDTVLTHLIHKKRDWQSDHPLMVPAIHKTREGDLYHEGPEKDAWRCFTFIPGGITYQKISDPLLAKESGRIIGQFQTLLADLKEPLNITIESFHDILFRLKQYEKILNHGNPGRIDRTLDEQKFVEARIREMVNYQDALKNSKAPLRVTHNDTKINNILFDRNNRAICLVDYDTIMPGYIHYDFGDALRTLASTAAEDEKALHKVTFDHQLFEAFSDGYLRQVSDVMLHEEIELLPFAPLFMTFIIGLRFLTDYIDNDRYYSTSKPHHNLFRARAQFRLLESMESQRKDMEQIFRKRLKMKR